MLIVNTKFGTASSERSGMLQLKTNRLDEGEVSRLEALASYGILDTEPEKEFDDIAKIASRICGTPIAVVNLVSDQIQFFKAEVGLGVRSTPYGSSFCAKAILKDEFMMIPDATRDHRFDCNPLVVGDLHIRFYAGAILKSAEGYPIGTVCVLGYEPLVLDEVQQDTLRLLAKQVEEAGGTSDIKSTDIPPLLIPGCRSRDAEPFRPVE